MMRRDIHHKDDLYKLGLLVGYNPDAHRDPDTGKGAGSCIFLHIWRGPARPTVGCTAMPEESMQALIAWLDPGAKPLLVQGTRSELERLVKERRLPYSVPPGPTRSMTLPELQLFHQGEVGRFLPEGG
jgi:hypothetical protein